MLVYLVLQSCGWGIKVSLTVWTWWSFLVKHDLKNSIVKHLFSLNNEKNNCICTGCFWIFVFFAFEINGLNNSGKRSTVTFHDFISPISSFTKLFCLASFRRSTKQRESLGTTSTTQTMWAVSTSSARNPPVCSTCWMRRASKNKTWPHSCLLAARRNVVCFDKNWSCPFISSSLFLYLYFFFSLFFSLYCHCSFPHATDETLLAKFKQQHQGNKYFVPTPVLEPAFVIRHFAGKVKYQIKVQQAWGTEKTWCCISRMLWMWLNCTWIWPEGAACNVPNIFDVIRISGRRTPTTCGRT